MDREAAFSGYVEARRAKLNRTACLEESADPGEDQDFLHVSLDRGFTWQRIQVTDGDTIADLLQQLG